MLSKIHLYYNTIKYLQLKQILGRVYAAFKFFLYSKEIISISKKSFTKKNIISKTKFVFHEPWNNATDINRNVFKFIGIHKNFNDKIDWNCFDLPLLWRFNLHYFNYLHLLNKQEQIDLCLEWIKSNPMNNKVAWHPYVLSLRIVNWCKASLDNKEINENLYIQTAFLFRNLEFYHPANHYLENARALIFAGLYYYNTDEAKIWLEKGIKIYKKEINNQILADGVYFEKSIMYHAIILEGILDVLNILPEVNENYSFFVDSAEKMLFFLSKATHPNGTIALINDATEEIASSTSKLLEYASQLKLKYDLSNKDSIYFPNGKFYTFSDNYLYFIIKSGAIGPDNIPAHAHADIFTFELSFNGEKIFVDSGVFDYQSNEMRKYCRSTNAHNCVSIDDRDQAEMWGVFRVGNRYKPENDTIVSDNGFSFESTFSGYGNIINDEILQQRKIHYNAITKEFTISDEIKGNGKHKIVSNLHLHPEIKLKQINENTILAGSPNNEFKITIPYGEISIEDSYYCPKFGIKQSNKNIRIISNILPCELIYKVQF